MNVLLVSEVIVKTSLQMKLIWLYCMRRKCSLQHGASDVQPCLQEDHMPSYFLAETCKYAFLIANSTFLEVRSNSHSTHTQLPFGSSHPSALLFSIQNAGQLMSHTLLTSSSLYSDHED